MTSTDAFMILMLLLLAYRGSRQSFWRSLIGPATFVAGTLAGYLWFLLTRQFLAALAVAIIAPIILSWATHRFITYLLRRKICSEPTIISRCAGALINTLWGGSMVVILLALLMVLPLKSLGLGDISDDISVSTTYALLRRPFEAMGAISAQDSTQCLSGLCSMSSQKKAEIAADDDLKALLEDPRMQKIINDPLLQTAAQNRDIATLLSSPAVLELTQDPQFIARALKIYPRIKERVAEAQAAADVR